MIKKRIIVDLDVVTIAYFPSQETRKQYCIEFINRAINKEFIIYTPSNFELLLFKWKFKELRDKILDFYKIASDRFIDKIDIVSKLNANGITIEKLESKFKAENIKSEDIIILLIASINKLDIVSFNRKHLKDKELQINEVLKKNGLNPIKIRFPNEI